MDLLKQESSEVANEANMRLAVVGEQYQIESSVAQSRNGVAIFVVPTIPTPMFIDPEAVIWDQVFKLKQGFENAIPTGLIPEEKANNPQQLSTVLARVLSVNAMLNAEIKVIVMHVEAERLKADNKMGFVDKKQVVKLQNEFSDHLFFKEISKADYEKYKDNICAATYCYFDRFTVQTVGIDATQINTPNIPHKWGVRHEEEVKNKVTMLNNLLINYELSPIDGQIQMSPMPGYKF
jgi:hypothetical protein